MAAFTSITGRLRALPRAPRKLADDLRDFADARSAAVGVYDRLLRFSRSKLWPYRGKRTRVRLKSGGGGEFHIRLGASDLSVVDEIFRKREYDGAAATLPANAGLILDLGVNIGVSVRYWRSRCPNALILGVEPDPDNLDMARANIGSDARVRLVRAFVGGRRRTAYMDKRDGAWAIRMVDGPEVPASPDAAETAPVLTIQDLLADLPPDMPIDLVKMDIEGAEREVLGADCAWLKRTKLLVIETHDPYKESHLRADLERIVPGFDMTLLRAQLGCSVFGVRPRPETRAPGLQSG